MHQRALVNVSNGETVADRHRNDRDQFGRVATNDRTTENDPGGRVRDDLHEAAWIIVDLGLGRRGERDFGDPDLAPFGERVRLGKTDVGDLRLGEDR